MGRLRGCLWLTAGLVVALLAGAVAFIALQRARDDIAPEDAVSGVPMVEVVIAAQAIELRTQLTEEDVMLTNLPVDSVPEGAIGEVDTVVGQVTLVDLFQGEVILAQRLLDPNVITGDGRLALFIAEDEVLMAYPIEDLMSRIHVLKPGDHVDLLFTLDFPAETEDAEGGQVTFTVLENVVLAALAGDPEEPSALLFTLSPQDALILKHAKDTGGILDIVLRAPGTERPFDTEPVDTDYMRLHYRIPAGGGQ